MLGILTESMAAPKLANELATCCQESSMTWKPIGRLE